MYYKSDTTEIIENQSSTKPQLPRSSFFAPKRQWNDRYIHLRPQSELEKDLQRYKLDGGFNAPTCTPYVEELTQAMFGVSYTSLHKAPILGFEMPAPSRPIIKHTPILTLENYKALDAPGMPKDFYINPICWGDVLYIALGDDLYTYNPQSGAVNKIQAGSIQGDSIAALSYAPNQLLRTGTTGSFQYIDTNTAQEIRQLNGVTYNSITAAEPNIFYLMSRGGSVVSHFDTRTPGILPLFYCPNYAPMSIVYNASTQTLALSTSIDIQLFNINQSIEPKCIFTGHVGGSKALAFSEDGKTIASGGGIEDKTIKIWSANSGKVLSEENIDNQVASLHWRSKRSIFVTTGHTAPSVSCWYMKKSESGGTTLVNQATSSAHTDRVLYSAQDPQDKAHFVTASPDETLRFWKAGESQKSTDKSSQGSIYPSSWMPTLR